MKAGSYGREDVKEIIREMRDEKILPVHESPGHEPMVSIKRGKVNIGTCDLVIQTADCHGKPVGHSIMIIGGCDLFYSNLRSIFEFFGENEVDLSDERLADIGEYIINLYAELDEHPFDTREVLKKVFNDENIEPPSEEDMLNSMKEVQALRNRLEKERDWKENGRVFTFNGRSVHTRPKK